MKLHAVIMAGGRGTRFWPWSRRLRPKQLLPIAGGQPMLRATVDRLRPLLPPEQIHVATSRDLESAVRELMPDLPAENLILEPMAMDTAPCVGLATVAVMAQEPEAVLALLPADHHIRDEAAFRDVLEAAAEEAASSGAILTLGNPPSRPETGYGYIRRGRPLGEQAGHTVYDVERFAEKPDTATAERYLASGDYLWNGGMFLFRGSTMRGAIRELMPDLDSGLEKLSRAWPSAERADVLRSVFPTLPRTSIDYGIMERYPSVRTIEAAIGWSDVGSFDEVALLTPPREDGNRGEADLIAVESRGNLVIGGDRPISLVGVEDLIVVDTPDALLICRRGEGQKIKNVVEVLERDGRKDLL